LQVLGDDVADHLPSWKAGLLSRSSQTMLVKSTLLAILVHISIAVKLNPGTLWDIDKVHRGFIWCGTSSASVGHCMVAWSKVTRSIELGGLGVLDLDRFGHVLHFCWGWLVCVDPSRSWTAMLNHEDKIEHAMF
jgi:hypothetical protein